MKCLQELFPFPLFLFKDNIIMKDTGHCFESINYLHISFCFFANENLVCLVYKENLKIPPMFGWMRRGETGGIG